MTADAQDLGMPGSPGMLCHTAGHPCHSPPQSSSTRKIAAHPSQLLKIASSNSSSTVSYWADSSYTGCMHLQQNLQHKSAVHLRTGPGRPVTVATGVARAMTSMFKVGDVVDVKKHGRAVVIAGPRNEPGSEQHGRFQVQYQEDGTTFWVTPARLRHRQLARKRCVVAYKTAEYRQAAIHNTNQWDVCLEIGCHAGVTTSLLSKRCRGVLGVDMTATVIDVAKSKYPHVKFAQLDGNDMQGCQQAVASLGLPAITKVLIDISGQAPLAVLAPLLHTWMTEVPGVLLVVKNRALHCLVMAVEAQATTTSQQADGSADGNASQHQVTQGSAPRSPRLAAGVAGLSLGQPGTAETSDDEDGSVMGGQEFKNKTVDEVIELLLGGEQGVEPQLRQQLLWLCEQCETFKDQAAPHRKQFVRQRVEDDQVVVPAEVAALQQAARKAEEVVGKGERKQAKLMRRAARKAAGVQPPA